MKCIKCGADLPDGSVFCTNCGAKLDAGQPAQAPSQPQASAQPVAGQPGKPQQASPYDQPAQTPSQPQASAQPVAGQPGKPQQASPYDQPAQAPSQPQAPAQPVAGQPGKPQQASPYDQPAQAPSQPQAPDQPVTGQPGKPQQASPYGQPVQTSAGQPQPVYGQQMPNGVQNRPAPKAPRAPMDPKKKKGFIIGISCGAAALVLIIGVLMFFMLKRTKIDMNKYVKLSYSGYDTQGEVEYEFDEAAFVNDYQKKIKLGGKYPEWFKKVYGFSASKSDKARAKKYAANTFAEEMNTLGYDLYTVSPTSGTSNGDEVQVTWELTKQEVKMIEKAYRVTLVYTDFTDEVKGLDEIETFDPFDEIDVTFEGTSPYGSVNIETKDGATLDKYMYSADVSYDLKNGDTVTISIGDYSDDYYISYYEKLPTEKTKEYTVEGLDEYITSFDQVTEDALAAMKSQTEDVINEDVADFDEDVTFDSMEYIGYYFATPKVASEYGTQNVVVIVYKLNVGDPNFAKFSYYRAVEYDNLTLKADGTVDVDVTDYDTNWNYFSTTGANGYSNYHSYYGYSSLESLDKSYVQSNSADYNFENGIVDPDETTSIKNLASSTDAELDE